MGRIVFPRAWAWALGAALLAATAPLSAETLRVRPLVRDGRVLVSFALEQGFTDEVRAVVRSGLRTTFTYTVELRLKVPAWVDRTVSTAVVSTTVEYDNLTRRHTVSRTLDGRIEDSRVVEDEAEVRQMMTMFERLPLFETRLLEQNRECASSSAPRRAAQRRAVLAVGRRDVGLGQVHLHP